MSRTPLWVAITLSLVLAPGSLFFGACGTVDPGETTVNRWRNCPDPVTFATEVHPLLVNNCTTSGCHTGSTTLSLHPAEETLPPDAEIGHPSELPQPFLQDYYTVLAFCDLDFESASPLLLWATGERGEHSGGEALSGDEKLLVIEWLEGKR